MKLKTFILLFMLEIIFCKNPSQEIDQITLIDQNHHLIKWDMFRKSYKLVFFGYTSCPDICPIALGTMDHAKMILINKPLVLIFITIDPERDTPERIKNYLSNFKSPIVGLTGDNENLKILYKYFNISFKKEFSHSTDNKHILYGYNHTPFIYFLSPKDKIVKTFPTGISSSALVLELQKYLY